MAIFVCLAYEKKNEAFRKVHSLKKKSSNLFWDEGKTNILFYFHPLCKLHSVGVEIGGFSHAIYFQLSLFNFLVISFFMLRIVYSDPNELKWNQTNQPTKMKTNTKWIWICIQNVKLSSMSIEIGLFFLCVHLQRFNCN